MSACAQLLVVHVRSCWLCMCAAAGCACVQPLVVHVLQFNRQFDQIVFMAHASWFCVRMYVCMYVHTHMQLFIDRLSI